MLCPVTYIELAPEFNGDFGLQEKFCRKVGVRSSEPWTHQDTENAFSLWAGHVAKRRLGRAGKRPVADVLIEAFAQRFQGLITRNVKHFSTVEVVTP